MRSARSSPGAGRTSTGSTPTLAHSWGSPTLRDCRLAARASANRKHSQSLAGQPSPRPTTATSNRQWKGLEIAVTHTKQTPDPFLIDNENQLLRKIACRAGCLPTIKPAPSRQPRYRTTTQSTNSHPTIPAISNRQWKGLEIAVTRTKQTPDPFLIDNENALFSAHARSCLALNLILQIPLL